MDGRLWAAVCIVLTVVGSAQAGTSDPTESRQQFTQRIDALVAQQWEKAQVQPAPAASDAEFLRRACLDLTGVIPAVGEVRQFLADTGPNKRERKIDELVRRPGFATHLANGYRAILLPESSQLVQYGSGGFGYWLRSQFADNVAYDEVVRKLLTASGNFGQNGPELFYIAQELKPEELAASTSRIFLGVQISCAQCHNHPFDHWKKEDFWSFAAFFARLQRPQGGSPFASRVADAIAGEIKLPDTQTVVLPRFLNGDSASEQPNQTRRQQLAQWMTAADNPYFAKAAVNRVWSQLFGRGLVEPVDDLGSHNPASHPELLEEMAEYFVASRYDLRELYAVVAKTRAYQLTSEVISDSPPAPELFAHMAIKSLSAEQLYDCLGEAIRRREPVVPAMGQASIGAFDPARQAFLTKFRAPTQKKTEFQAGIPQALTMMNGALTAAATDLSRSDLLISLQAPLFDNDQRIEVLFLSILSRPPTSAERERCAKYLIDGGSSRNTQQALADLLWALVNSGEFILNH